MATIQEAVAEKISKSGVTVKEIIIDSLVAQEVAKRVDIITKALTKLESMEKDFKKINGKNDNISYVAGVKVESMTEKRFQEIEKSKQNIDGLKKLIDNCLEKNDEDSYTKLNEQVGQSNKQSEPDKDSKSNKESGKSEN